MEKLFLYNVKSKQLISLEYMKPSEYLTSLFRIVSFSNQYWKHFCGYDMVLNFLFQMCICFLFLFRFHTPNSTSILSVSSLWLRKRDPNKKIYLIFLFCGRIFSLALLSISVPNFFYPLVKCSRKQHLVHTPFEGASKLDYNFMHKYVESHAQLGVDAIVLVSTPLIYQTEDKQWG